MAWELYKRYEMLKMWKNGTCSGYILGLSMSQNEDVNLVLKMGEGNDTF